MRGKVAKFWPDKGWGFIRPAAGGQDVWMHVADLEQGTKADLAEGVMVFYEVGNGQGGRTKAVHIRVIGYEPDQDEPTGDWRDEVRAMAQKHLGAFMADLEEYLSQGGEQPV